jgi:peroxiredoxin
VLSTAADLSIGSAAPAFSLKNTDGKPISLSDFKDCKGVVVVFTNNGCTFAKDYESRLLRLYADYHPKGIVIALINPSDTHESVTKAALEKKYPFPYLTDESQAVCKAYGATNLPHAFLFDANLKLIYRGRIDDNTEEAKVRKHDLRDALDLLLAGTPNKIETPATKPFGCSIKPR